MYWEMETFHTQHNKKRQTPNESESIIQVTQEVNDMHMWYHHGPFCKYALARLEFKKYVTGKSQNSIVCYVYVQCNAGYSNMLLDAP